MKKVVGFCSAGFVFLALIGCATTPERREPPEWIEVLPRAEMGDTYLSGYGTGDTGDDARARAQQDLTAQYARILLSEFDPDIRGVSDETAALIEGIAGDRASYSEPLDSYHVRRPDKVVEVYLLARFTVEDVESDVSEIQAAVAERAAARAEATQLRPAEDPAPEMPPGPDRLVPPPGENLQGVRYLLSSVPDSLDEAESVLDMALSRASELVFSATPGEFQVALGTPPDRTITVRIAGLSASEQSHGVELAVVETGPEIDGRRTVHRETAVTGPDGTVRIDVRDPVASGVTRIRVEPVWLEESLAAWTASHGDRNLRRNLETLASRLNATVNVRVTSGAASIPTAVIFIDRDIAGNPIAGRDAARGAFQQFRDQGFRTVAVELSPATESALANLTEPTVTDLYDILPFEVLASAERVVIGSAGITQFTETEGVTVVLGVEARAFDLRRDRLLTSVTLEERMTGRDPRTTLRSAFNSAGRRAARHLAPRLP